MDNETLLVFQKKKPTRLAEARTCCFEKESVTVLVNHLTTASTSNESQVIIYTQSMRAEGEELSSALALFLLAFFIGIFKQCWICLSA